MHLLFQTTRPLGSETSAGDDDVVGPVGQAIQTCAEASKGAPDKSGHSSKARLLVSMMLPRPHQGIEQRIPCQSEQLGALPVNGKLSSRPVLSGLHHDYYWQAAECVGQETSQLRSHLH